MNRLTIFGILFLGLMVSGAVSSQTVDLGNGVSVAEAPSSEEMGIFWLSSWNENVNLQEIVNEGLESGGFGEQDQTVIHFDQVTASVCTNLVSSEETRAAIAIWGNAVTEDANQSYFEHMFRGLEGWVFAFVTTDVGGSVGGIFVLPHGVYSEEYIPDQTNFSGEFFLCVPIYDYDTGQPVQNNLPSFCRVIVCLVGTTPDGFKFVFDRQELDSVMITQRRVDEVNDFSRSWNEIQSPDE